ncbi:MAG: 3-isopropylmalate dehydratase large subunit [Rhodospirillales bacterium]|nr:3-isopropylmalate dehydratase large subunit [Rhodospirillales bacterium]
MNAAPRSLFDKVWQSHVVAMREDGQALLGIDRHLLHEGSFHGFAMLDHAGRHIRRPELTFAVADHYVPTRDRARPIADPAIARMVRLLAENAARHGIAHFGLSDARQGIVHVVAPEQGITLPGLTLVCGDSHTSTHGAFGALAFGIGATEVAHVLATQMLWQRRPRTLRVTLDGALGAHVAAKDVILAIIARIGAGGAAGHVLEYDGAAIRALDMAGRMTICNMSIEAGARAGMIAPDETTFQWVAGRAYAPKGALFDQAVAAWRALPSDPGAAFDREVTLDAGAITPHVTWGTSPETALPITARVPEPRGAQAGEIRTMLDYMGLTPGMALQEIAIDRVFIGSCTNARIEDLRAAAAVLRGRRAVVPGLVVPGSTPVRAQAEAEGLDRIFREAGLEWREAGCSMCVGINGDLLAPGQRSASTTNRNFQGRQGPGARTHLMSPAMVAAAAVTGRISDVRQLQEG